MRNAGRVFCRYQNNLYGITNRTKHIWVCFRMHKLHDESYRHWRRNRGWHVISLVTRAKFCLAPGVLTWHIPLLGVTTTASWKKTSRSHVIIDIQTVLSVLVHAGILPGARARKHIIHDYGALITDVMPVAPLLFSPAIHHCAAMHYICSSKIDVKIMTTDENQERLLSKSQIGGCLFRI